MGTLRTGAEVALTIIEGGSRNIHESQYDIRFVERVLLDCRNLLLSEEFKSRRRRGVPYSYYQWTEYEIVWLQRYRVLGVELPARPMSLDYDCGIAVQSASLGVEEWTFVRAQPNWCKDNPRLAWAEGNKVWELHGNILAFPNSSRGDIEGMLIRVGLVAQTPDGSGDIDLAPEHEQRAIDLAVQSILSGRSPRDLMVDANEDQGRARR